MSIKHTSGATRLASVSLAFTGLMWLLPFLDFRHIAPISTFYQECGAAMLGLFAMPLLVTRRYWEQPEIPRIVLLPIGLSLLVLLQLAAGKIGYLDQALLATLYLLWAALLIMLGHRLREELGLPALVTVLALFLLVGAWLNALVGVYQYYFWCSHPDYLFLNYLKVRNFSGSLAGCLGQPNHFADYITLGLASLGLLYLRWQLRAWQVALLAVPLLFVLTLSGSRSAGLYLLCMAGMAFLCQRRDKSCLPLLYYSLVLILCFGLMHFAVKTPWLAGCSGGLTSGERLIAGAGSLVNEVSSGGHATVAGSLANEVGSGGHATVAGSLVNKVGSFVNEAGSFVNNWSSDSLRLQMWREAWLIFTQSPLLGAGFGQYAWQHFQLGLVLRNAGNAGMNSYAHNLVLHIAAEMGLAGLLILFGTLALWFWQARTAPRTIYHWWGYCLLAVLAIHSLLEYPLWYAYFLGVAALALGMFDTTTYRLKLRGFGRLSVAAMLLVGLLSLSQMLYIYRYQNFETLVRTLYASVTDDSYIQRIRVQIIHDSMVEVRARALLLRPYVDSFLGDAGWDHIADKGAMNERVMHYKPFNAVVYRQAVLLAKLGRQAEARVQIERAIWAYPEDFPAARGQLRLLVDRDTDPERFSALLEFALQKYEERQRAALAKS